MKITFIGGCGRLGLPMAAWSAFRGHDVIIADTDEEAIKKVNQKKIDRMEPFVGALVLANEILAVTDTAWAVEQSELINIIVPTPSDDGGRLSIEHILATIPEIAKGLNSYRVINVMSTVMPRSVRFIGQHIENMSGLIAGEDFGLAYTPEFIRQGAIIHYFSNPDFVVIGQHDENSGNVVEQYCRSIIQNDAPIYRMSLESGEIAKIGLNAAVVTKIGVANELAWLCHNTPYADAKDVLRAIGEDNRIGHRFFKAGTWTGGPCFPRDSHALAQTLKGDMPLAKAITKFQDTQLNRVVCICNNARTEFVKTGTLFPKIGILGATYKPEVDILEESQGLALTKALGIKAIHDPTLDCPPLEEFIVDKDILVLMTCWEEYKELEDLDLSGKVVIDMWGWLENLNCEKYIRFGRGAAK